MAEAPDHPGAAAPEPGGEAPPKVGAAPAGEKAPAGQPAWPTRTAVGLVALHIVVMCAGMASSSTGIDPQRAEKLGEVTGRAMVMLCVAGAIGYYVFRRSTKGLLAGVVVVLALIDAGFITAALRSREARLDREAAGQIDAVNKEAQEAMRARLESSGDMRLDTKQAEEMSRKLTQATARLAGGNSQVGEAFAWWQRSLMDRRREQDEASEAAVKAGISEPGAAGSLDDLRHLRGLAAELRVAAVRSRDLMRTGPAELGERLSKAGMAKEEVANLMARMRSSGRLTAATGLVEENVAVCDARLAQIDLLIEHYGQWKHEPGVIRFSGPGQEAMIEAYNAADKRIGEAADREVELQRAILDAKD